MALQKGERCCGKQEGSAGIICGFLHGKLPVTKTIQGRDGQENLFRRPKNTPKKPQTKLNPPPPNKRKVFVTPENSQGSQRKSEALESRRYLLSGKFFIVLNHPGKQLGEMTDGTRGCEGTGREAVVASWTWGSCSPWAPPSWRLQKVSPPQG